LSEIVHSSPAREFSPPETLGQLQRGAWGVGLIGAAACVVGYLTRPEQLLQSYLVAWLLWLGVAAGCLAILMLHHLTRGAWGLMIRRPLEAAARTLPALGLLFLPVLLNLDRLYPWAGPEAADDELIQHKAAYLNQPGFIGRTVFYLALWSLLAFVLSRLSRRQDATGDGALFRRMQAVAAPGLGLYALTATFAAVDWIMSLDPHWFSSIFGVYFMGGQGVSALAFIVPVALYLSQRKPMQGVLQAKHFHDYGKLLLAFVMLWTYFALSQLLIIWSANIPEEITWYIERGQGGWLWLSIALGVLHFALPFLLLLSRDLKRSAKTLTWVAVLLLAMRWVDLYWQAAPTFHHHGPALHWLDPVAVVGIGGIFLGIFFGGLKKTALLPLNDPYLEEALADE
jgi:hypothetical protein